MVIRPHLLVSGRSEAPVAVGNLAQVYLRCRVTAAPVSSKNCVGTPFIVPSKCNPESEK